MNELVQRLSQGNHSVEVSLRPNPTVKAFINTKGGTELGIRLDREASNFKEADFESETGKVYLVGNLTLNYEKVRCIADIDLKNLEGEGHLEPVLESVS
jgi:hypothetical protein